MDKSLNPDSSGTDENSANLHFKRETSNSHQVVSESVHFEAVIGKCTVQFISPRYYLETRRLASQTSVCVSTTDHAVIDGPLPGAPTEK